MGGSATFPNEKRNVVSPLAGESEQIEERTAP